MAERLPNPHCRLCRYRAGVYCAQSEGGPRPYDGMSGMMSPRLWAQGRFQEVIDYVSQDVRMTLQVALECEKRRQFEWITRRGTASSMSLPRGWFTVEEALRQPEPDTSWMDSPIPRSNYTSWITTATSNSKPSLAEKMGRRVRGFLDLFYRR